MITVCPLFPLAMTAGMRRLSTESSILHDPSVLPMEAQKAALKLTGDVKSEEPVPNGMEVEYILW